MATISYKCNECKREVELVENPHGFTIVGKCVITNGCSGRLYRTERNPNNVRESNPSFVSGLDNYVPRRMFYSHTQHNASNMWMVHHNMGTVPLFEVFVMDATGGTSSKLPAERYTVTIVSENEAHLSFPSAVSGMVQAIARSTVPQKPKMMAEINAEHKVTTNKILTVAVPKYIPLVALPSPTDSRIDICDANIRLEIEITRPNEEPFVCFEDIPTTIDSRSPWANWPEILVTKRRNYCIRAFDVTEMHIFGGDLVIPEGTLIRFLRIDYGNGRSVAIPGRGMVVLLTSSPYTSIDKVTDKIIDTGEMVNTETGYFVYRDGEFYIDTRLVEQSYPATSRYTPSNR